MSDRDRLGSKLREKERAEEDRYFAKRDAELIAKLAQAHKDEQERVVRELARSRCPKCGVRLTERPVHGVVIDECRDCHGIWLDPGELERLIAQAGLPTLICMEGGYAVEALGANVAAFLAGFDA